MFRCEQQKQALHSGGAYPKEKQGCSDTPPSGSEATFMAIKYSSASHTAQWQHTQGYSSHGRQHTCVLHSSTFMFTMASSQQVMVKCLEKRVPFF